VRLLALVAALVLGGAAGALLVNAGTPLGPAPALRLGSPPTARVVVTTTAPTRIAPVTAPVTSTGAASAAARAAVAPVVHSAPQPVSRAVAPPPAQAPTATPVAPAATSGPQALQQPQAAARQPIQQTTASLPPGQAKKLADAAGHVPPGQAKKLQTTTTHVPPGQAKKLAPAAGHVPPGQAKKQHGGH
jgi:hypothetical protein